MATLGVACTSANEVGRFLGDTTCTIAAEDAHQLTWLGPTTRSHWLQPWRAYRDTWPAIRLAEGAGYPLSSPGDAATQAAVLSSAGFRRASISVPWNSMAFDTPDKLTGAALADVRQYLSALAAHQMRPLLVLDAYENAPVPSRAFDISVLAGASKGATELRVDAKSLAQIVVGRSGLDGPSGVMADVLFSAKDDAAGKVKLSKALPMDLSAGQQKAVELRYAPFGRPFLVDGKSNPSFEATLAGWLAYVRAVVAETNTFLGGNAFDVEIWNELSQGARFLNINSYYDAPIDSGPGNEQDVIPRAILQRTVTMLRGPDSPAPGVGIGDGFANTDWKISGTNTAPGVTALDRHVSVQVVHWPTGLDGVAPSLDALGQLDGKIVGTKWAEKFAPTYDASFPELPLTAITPMAGKRPGQIIRDLAPLTTVDAQGVSHGRQTHPEGAAVPQTWITSANWNPDWARKAGTLMDLNDIIHLQTKSVLRSFSAYFGTGSGALFLYVGPDSLTLIDWTQPGGGEAVATLRRFFGAFGTFSGPVAPLRLQAVSGCTSGFQWAGDNSGAHPTQWNRNLVTAFPFQTDARAYVISAYVMTENLAGIVRPASSGVERFDLPEEVYALHFDRAAQPGIMVSATDPMSGLPVAATLVPAATGELTIEVALTDSPRLVRVQFP